MRIETCRSCGTEMVPCENCKKCPICKEPMNLFCPSCNSTSQVQVHQHFSKVYA